MKAKIEITRFDRVKRKMIVRTLYVEKSESVIRGILERFKRKYKVQAKLV